VSLVVDSECGVELFMYLDCAAGVAESIEGGQYLEPASVKAHYRAASSLRRWGMVKISDLDLTNCSH